MSRGIADFGGKTRVNDWQFVATLAAASAARLMLERDLELPRTYEEQF